MTMLDRVLESLRESRLLQRPGLRRLRNAGRRLLRRSEGEKRLFERFAALHGYRLDLKNPQTFSEKVFCRMVRWNRRVDPRFTLLADKLAVRSHVSARIGDEYLVPLLWHGKDPQQIPFDTLPTHYVVKTNHGSGYIIIVEGTADRDDIVRKATTWVESNLYWACREAQYYHIAPQVMIEELLASPDGSHVLLYRFWCFDGVPRILNVDNLDHTIGLFYDLRWNPLGFTHQARRPPKRESPKPLNLDRMVALATRLSEGLDFVRVDLYNVDGRIYFSEFTFTPDAGSFAFDPADWNLRIGQMWTLRD